MFEEMKKRLEKVLEVVRDDLRTVKAGRARPEMVEDLRVEAYPGVYNMVKELASIAAPDTNMLTISPWDQGIIRAMEAGLKKADNTLNPIIDGNMIRISVPALNEERRKDLVKLTHQKIESGKIMMRDVRIDTKKMVDAKKDDAGVSEDDIRRWLDEMQKMFDEYQIKLDELEKGKEKELMEI